MCGRYYILVYNAEAGKFFPLEFTGGPLPLYNIAPTQQAPVVRAADAGRECVRLRWGFIPSWSKDGKLSLINAMSETAADKPMFRSAFRRRRCILPASGFYEWQPTAAKKKQPYAIRLADESPFGFAGLWERWEGPDGPVESCCILTTQPNELVAGIHNRMPVILDPPVL